MPELTVQHVDELLIERIKSLARERRCSVNEVLLDALRYGLNVTAAHQSAESWRDSQVIGELDGHWEAAERGVFQEALLALAKTRPTQFAPESIRYAEPDPGAE
ncbi:MAG TPA: hypothetical protein VN043_01300 [Rhodanobacter sp.]|nr:hypothetical protein [Rhodanobacter sp.]